MIQSLTASRISEIVGGRFWPADKAGLVNHVVVDSRNVLQPETTLFVALKGAKFDGHEFIGALHALGVRHFLVLDERVESLVQNYPATYISTKDPKSSLQELAAFQRGLYKAPMVCITGSNGKTIVKEWLGQILGQQFSVAKSPKSYNSQVGVPLSLFGISPFHQVAVMEAGISRPGEMQRLETMLRPDIGVFTNLGTAHEEGFDSEEQKLQEKALLFAHCKFIVYRKDHSRIAVYLEANFEPDRLIGWSSSVGTEYTLSVKKETDRSKIILLMPDMGLFTFSVPFVDKASLENIRHVITVALTLGMLPETIQEGLDHLKAVDMRLTLKAGVNESLIIDDTYNNDLAGLRLALDFMAAQRPKNRKILILSDLLEIGDNKLVYEEVAQLITYHQIDELIGVGEEIQVLKKHFPGYSRFYPDTESLLGDLNPEDFDNDLILITGARKYGFELVANSLQQRIHGTTLEINLNALTHNYNFYKTKILPQTKVMVMVKAFAYGGGATEIANHLAQLKADYLAVAYTDEGVALREQGITLPIMVLNPMQEAFIHLHKYRLEPVVYSPQFFRQLGKYCRSHVISMKIHLDLDTGMHRLGFEERHIPEILRLIGDSPELEIASLYTHLAGADEQQHQHFSLQQLEAFLQMSGQIMSALDYTPLRHALNSAGIIRYPEYQLDMVRLGIGLYGVEVSNTFTHQLKPISTLKTTISQIKPLAKGQTVGYGRKGQMKAEGKIATIAIGYADGYDRRFSNGKGFVLIHGQRAPVIGNVCMDMCMVDITDIEAREGDEVIIYGDGIPLKELSQQIGTIPYELLTNISSRVKRVYYLD